MPRGTQPDHIKPGYTCSLITVPSDRVHLTDYKTLRPYVSLVFAGNTTVGMGRGKVELKRIEDKSSRQVSFSKRRNGLMKKAHELAMMCDVDVALFAFSGKDRLYEFSSGESMDKLLTRYQSFKKMEEMVRVNIHGKLAAEFKDVCTADELTQIIQQHLEDNNIKLLDISGLGQLEHQLGSLLQQVRIRKIQLKLGVIKALKDKEIELKKERKFIMDEITAARMNVINTDAEPTQTPVMEIQINW